MRDIINSKILLSASTLIVALVVVVGATYAFFSDTETSADNTFVSGAVDLKIDNESYYNGIFNEETSWTSVDLTDEKFFDFPDVKPSDYGEDTISVKVETNDAWVCADVTLTSNLENNRTPNEIEDGDLTDDPNGGELANRINFIWWADDGDNVLETDENLLPGGPIGSLGIDQTATVALADSQGSIYSSPSLSANGAMKGNQTYYIGKAWCFGAIDDAPLAQSNYSGPDADNNADSVLGTPADGGYTCDSSGENDITQTDSLTADISFRAFQSRHNPTFTCEGNETTPTPTLTPTPTPIIACTSEDNIFASSASDNDQGLRKDSTPVLATRSNPANAFGAPQTAGLPTDSPVTEGTFFSLGFPLDGNTASIVYGFAEPFFQNPSGPDLQIYEVTGGNYPDEKVKVEVASSASGPWTTATPNPGIRDASLEMSVPSAQYVRVTDVSDINLFPANGDGFDVDAIKAFCTQVSQ